jgi:hypothetical protein
MRTPFVVVACLASSILSCVALWLSWPTPVLPTPVGADVDPAAVAVLRAQIAELTRRMDTLAQAQVAAPAAPRGDAFALDPHAAPSQPPAASTDPRWYLEQYVRSFADAPNGSEYYRLAVDAHIAELAADCAALVRSNDRLTPLRQALAHMLGKRRFADAGHVLDALLAAALPPNPTELALAALESLAAIASPRTVPGLELVVLQRTDEARPRALALLVELAGDATNAILARLWSATNDAALRLLLVGALQTNDAAAALAVLTGASGAEQPLRLAAANRVGEFDDLGIDSLVERWRPVETDAAVLAALGASVNGAGAAGWSAAKATGAPDADPSRDDPNAWAPRSPEMGRQWLQVTFPTAVISHGVRIFEVNAPGALAEVSARAPDGSWFVLWRGTTEVAGGSPRVLTWAPSAMPVRTLRLVLDTDRTPGWNEIDAVELLGPGGGQWAVRATASSSFASQNQPNGKAELIDGLNYIKAVRRR